MTPPERAVPSTVTIRPASDADEDALTAIYLDAARHHAAIDPEVHVVPSDGDALTRIRAKLANERLEVFVAVAAGGDAIGMLELERVEPPDTGNMLRAIPNARLGIAVREGRRGEGIGAALMAFAERWAAKHGCDAIVLDMSSSNADALRFYRRLGYRTYGLMLRKAFERRHG